MISSPTERSQSNVDNINDSNTSRDAGGFVQVKMVASRVQHLEAEMRGRSNEHRISSDFPTKVSSNALSKKREKKEAALLKLRGLFSSISVSRSDDSDNEVDAITRRQLFAPVEDAIDKQVDTVISSPESIELSVEINKEDSDAPEQEMEKQQTIDSRASPDNVTMFEPTDASSLGNIIVHDNYMIYTIR